MEIIADLHLHSRFSRACSKDLSLENLEKWARIKGLGLLGTGDFQHPKWREEIDAKLKEDDKGILRGSGGMPFVWQTEISLMYAQNGRRAVHLVVICPNSAVADKITEYLKSKGRIDYDGRPIFGISCPDFVRDLKDINDKIEIFGAHCMTPFFGLYGSKSGFDSLRECFKEQSEKIYAIESGMSADPLMLWRLKEDVNIVSFSDSHSFHPWRLGREATIFEFDELSYENVIKAIRTGIGLKGTIETPPAYGRYHWDGHRNCNFSCSPVETEKLNGICPICGKALTIGVDYRVEELAKEKSFEHENSRMFYEILPLHEVLALYLKSGMSSKKTWAVYNQLVERFGNELNVLLYTEKEEFLRKEVNPELVELILINRKNGFVIKPGYDGVYGQAIMPEKQAKLF